MKKEYLIDQQYADDISWITTNKNAKESSVIDRNAKQK